MHDEQVELKEISDPGKKKTAKADIIFIHGLGGNWEDTWHPKDEEEKFWPKWLAEDLPEACVWSLGYPAHATRWTSKGPGMDLSQRAGNIITHLSSSGIGKRPIIFICHSLGGLIVWL